MEVLALDQGFSFVRIVDWKTALVAVFAGKAHVVEYGDKTVRSAHEEHMIPSVIRFLKVNIHKFVSRIEKATSRVTRRKLWERDHGECQYCGRHVAFHQFQIEHIIPRSRGGENTWENLVVACARCNKTKRDRTPEEAGMRLRRQPSAPSSTGVLPKHIRPEWEPYLSYLA